MKNILLAVIIILTGCHQENVVTPSKPTTYYKELSIELVNIPLTKIMPTTLEKFKKQLVEYHIAENVTFIRHTNTNTQYCTTIWDPSLLNLFETKTRRIYSTDPRNPTIYIAHLPGIYLLPTYYSIAGMVNGNNSIVIFDRGYSEELLVNILLHEVCHLVDFVNLQERDESPVNPERPSHCNNPDCVMFWIAPIHAAKLDDACLKQLAAKIVSVQN